MADLGGATDLLLALLLGLVQGLTEFLPISSSAHLYAIPYLFAIEHPLLSSRAFAAVVHLGTLAAVLVALRSDVARLLGTALKLLFSLGRRRGEGADERLLLAIIVGTVPAVAFGLLAGDFLGSSVRTPIVVNTPKTRLRSPNALSTRLTEGQNLRSRTHASGNAARSRV